MSIAKITGPGLTGIAAAVVLLWVCFLIQHSMMRRAVDERIRVVHEVRTLQQKPRPVPTILPRRSAPSSTTIERV
jgi:hypothetical protein